MAILQSCCCWRSVRKGSFACGIYTVLLIALRFLASGSYQLDIASNKNLCVSQSSVSKSLKEIVEALNQPDIFNTWVQFPRTLNDLKSLRTAFFNDFQFPGVIGCIDCTHVAIIAPANNDDNNPEYIYVNRKNYHSLNVQIICDNNLKILNINPGFPGSCNDVHIWNHSNIKDVMEDLHRRGAKSFFLLGDSGYPLRPWLLTPLEENPIEGTPEDRYNRRHRVTRCLIERCNGLLKSRFRCLLKHRVLHYTPQMAASIIKACAVLHNMCIEAKINPPEDIEEDIDYGIYFHGVDPNENPRDLRRVNPDLTEFYYTFSAAQASAHLHEEVKYFQNNSTAPVSSFLDHDTTSVVSMTFNIINLSISSSGILTSCLLLYGLYRDCKFLLIPWILTIILIISFDITYVCYSFIAHAIKFNPSVAILITMDMFLISLNLYALLCVISQYQELKAGRGRALDDLNMIPNIHYSAQPTATSYLSTRRAVTYQETRPTPTQSPSGTAPHSSLGTEEVSPSIALKGPRKSVKFPDHSGNHNGSQLLEPWTIDVKSPMMLSKAADTAPLIEPHTDSVIGPLNV